MKTQIHPMTRRRLLETRRGCDHRHLARLVSIGCLFATIPSAASFLSPKPSITRARFFSTAECETSESSALDSSSQQSTWLNKGLLLSSFTDGLKTNPPALEWLMNALVETLWKEEQELTQNALRESNMASPCNGPDPVLLDQLETTDSVVEGLRQETVEWKTALQNLCESTQRTTLDLRVLYIPTAMYALRPNSTSKPGKQRGRNRADGKSRRNDLMGMLEKQLQEFCQDNDNTGFTLRTVTLDFDDASVKQPEEIAVGQADTEEAGFPESGKEAIREWKPHFIYVQGGNTFWLHHCMEKGDWQKDLMDACGFSEEEFSSVYCGVSAGSILAGESMQTACWKEWDDPSVVPNKQTYDDWMDTPGLDATGKVSWFPHMTEDWREMTEERTAKLLDSSDSESSSVRLIRDDQAFAVDGRTQTVVELL